jgi:hypothetical protein
MRLFPELRRQAFRIAPGIIEKNSVFQVFDVAESA